ncbi:hypothetical protein A4G19_11645 [Pasteurellaceae bacterium Macca]|nr:hypothetical protein [Pasteurellaceae bacterium Macca]
MKIKRFPLVLLVLSSVALAEQTVLLKIEGIKDKDLTQNVRIYLSQVSNDEADGSERYRNRVQETVDKALRAKGYYLSQYHWDLTPRKRPAKDLLTLTVQLDKPTLLDNREVTLSGEAKKDSDFEKLLSKDIPKKGTVLNHETYDNFKSSLEKLAQSKGYFDGKWLYHRLEVFPREHLADWRLSYESGERYRLGKISFKDSQIREDYLVNILRVKEGDFYHINDLSKMTSDYSGSNWFSSVLIEPELNEESKTVDLNLLFKPKRKNEMEVGIGFATEVGPRLQLNWKKPWINDRGHNFEMNSYVSKPEQNIEFGYKMPVKASPLFQYHEISGGLQHEDQNDTKFTGAHLGFQRFWNAESGWSFSLGVKARYDAFQQAEDKFKTFLLYPTSSLNYTKTDGNRFPLWGQSHKFTVNWGSKVWGSDVNFYTAKASSTLVHTLANNHRFVARAEVGYLKAGEFERIPPALRYFAGGDMSIRGFGYKDISPKDKNGKLTGGSHLVTGSVEYDYQFISNWWSAVFYDTGFSARNFNSQQLHSGVGVGVRWVSPIGAIKFDIATPVKSPSKSKNVQFYIGLGAEL